MRLKEVPGVFPEIASGPEWGCQSTSWDPNSERAGDSFPELHPTSSDWRLHSFWGKPAGGGPEREGNLWVSSLPIVPSFWRLPAFLFLSIKHINSIALFFFKGDNALL